MVPEPRSWLVDNAYAALRAAILANDYPPGHQVSAQELAGRFGMSRTPVQEAALRLQQEGLVEIVPKRGIRICAVSPEDLAEIYDVIIAIEAAAASRVAGLDADRRVGAAARLDAATDRMQAALDADDRVGWGEADAEFHRELVEEAGNRRFVRIMDTVIAQAHRARMLTVRLRTALDRSVAEHRAVTAAIRLGDANAAHAAIRDHRSRARDALLPLVRDLGLRHL